MDQTFGARLRAQRERQQVALATIAEETKINVALLESLERGDVSKWPGGLFRRAYLRSYAQKIGLEPESVVREFLELHPEPVEATSPVEAIAESAGLHRPRTRLGLMFAGLTGLRPARPEAGRHQLRDAEPAPPHHTVQAEAAPVPEHEPALQSSVEDLFAQPLMTPVADRIHSIREDVPADEEERFSAGLLPVTTADDSSCRNGRAVERDVASTARLVTRVACARDEQDVTAALEETVRIVEAQGAILWVWNAGRAALCPMLAHGYAEELLLRLPDVDRSTDNAIASAFRCAQKKIVHGVGRATGALVVPLVTTAGCVGVLALEFANGGEQHELAQALAMIVAAQLSTLFCAAQTGENVEWQRHGSLAAS